MKLFTNIFLLITLIFSINSFAHDNRSLSFKMKTLSWKTNWAKHSINYDELISGGPSKDGIPPLDNAKFQTIKEASSWIKDKEPLIFVNINNQTKAYPLQVLIWHEIVNDELANQKITVTFCPLCNASIVFDRNLDGKIYDFGTSGLLRHSDLVMYDRQTQSLWQQFTGKAIVGNMLNKQLKQINSSIVSFKSIKENYPKTLILSKDTGYFRDYGKNPYSGYDDINNSPFLLQSKTDERLEAMRRVATVSLKNKHKAYSYKILKNKKVINDKFENKNLVLFYKDQVLSSLDRSFISSSKDVGTVLVYDRFLDGKVYDFYFKDGFYFDEQTKSKWNIFGTAISGELKGKKLKAIIHGSHFWFAWAVFRPKTLIYK